MEPTDDDLIAACAEGDRDAFGSLYRRRRPDVYRFALHMTGSRAAAEDIAQDVFLAVMRDAHRYRRGTSGFVAWLLGIARNYVRRYAAERKMDPLDDVDGGAVAANDAVARNEELARLRAALAKLPARYREAVVLCDLEELSYIEAAKVIGCAVGTVRSRLHRGRARLAAHLKLGARRRAGARVPNWIL
ncbi:MAG TPA: sigma-70 family RNA polymerase sigma factor [Vicinamibacterales bacterium]|nr:sigma-70 family RNA polymerase sigma factor [Vicinamibacterales bacterium]